MRHSTVALPTLTLPPSKGRHRLSCTVLPPCQVARGEREEMYALLDRYLGGTSRDRFEADLGKREQVILLRETDSGRIQRCATLVGLNARADDEAVGAYL